MSTGIIITGILIALAGMITTILSLYHYYSLKKLMLNGAITTGTVESIKPVRDQNGDFSYYRLKYSVNGKVYYHKILTRSGKYDKGKNISIVYLPDDPHIAYGKCEFENIRLESFRTSILAVVLIFVAAIAILVLYAYDANTIIDIGLCILLYISSWVWFIDEHDRVYKSKSVIGTIIYAETNKRTCRVVAQYNIDGHMYETRQMNVPLKNSTKYNIGDIICVKYRENQKYSAIIEDDKMQLLYAKTAVILLSISTLLYIILSILYH